MLETNAKIIEHKVSLLNLAEELGNVSRARKTMGLYPHGINNDKRCRMIYALRVQSSGSRAGLKACSTSSGGSRTRVCKNVEWGKIAP